MMDRTQIWPEPGRDRQAVWRATDKFVLQLLVTDEAIKCKRSLLCLCLIDYGLAPLGFFCIWTVGGFSTLCMCLCAVWWGLSTAPKKENLSEPCLSDTVHTTPLPPPPPPPPLTPVQIACHRQGKGKRKWWQHCSTLYHRCHIHHCFTSKSLWQSAPEASIISGHTVPPPLPLLHIWGPPVI